MDHDVLLPEYVSFVATSNKTIVNIEHEEVSFPLQNWTEL